MPGVLERRGEDVDLRWWRNRRGMGVASGCTQLHKCNRCKVGGRTRQ